MGVGSEVEVGGIGVSVGGGGGGGSVGVAAGALQAERNSVNKRRIEIRVFSFMTISFSEMDASSVFTNRFDYFMGLNNKLKVTKVFSAHVKATIVAPVYPFT
ncbi:MAG: hypothetical protein AMXMBFR60_29240 [Chloroflexota bacterium]